MMYIYSKKDGVLASIDFLMIEDPEYNEDKEEIEYLAETFAALSQALYNKVEYLNTGNQMKLQEFKKVWVQGNY